MQIKLRILLLFAGAILSMFSNWIVVSDVLQFKLLVVSLIVLGVPHGALDLYIESKNLDSHTQSGNSILLKYLLNILAYATLWYFLPVMALVIFILITAYHFGEIDWLGKSETWIHKLTYTLIGMSWVLYFLSVNIEYALKIFIYLGNSNVTEKQWYSASKTTAPIALGALILFHVILFFYQKYFFIASKHFYFSILQLMTLLVICHYSTLWVGFGFYFGLWHSILSFDKIRESFHMPESFSSWIFLLKKAMPFSIMAWIGMLFVMFMFFNSQNSTSLISLLFITLSVLTLPHLQVFTKLKLYRAEN